MSLRVAQLTGFGRIAQPIRGQTQRRRCTRPADVTRQSSLVTAEAGGSSRRGRWWRRHERRAVQQRIRPAFADAGSSARVASPIGVMAKGCGGLLPVALCAGALALQAACATRAPRAEARCVTRHPDAGTSRHVRYEIARAALMDRRSRPHKRICSAAPILCAEGCAGALVCHTSSDWGHARHGNGRRISKRCDGGVVDERPYALLQGHAAVFTTPRAAPQQRPPPALVRRLGVGCTVYCSVYLP